MANKFYRFGEFDLFSDDSRGLYRAQVYNTGKNSFVKIGNLDYKSGADKWQYTSKQINLPVEAWKSLLKHHKEITEALKKSESRMC